MIDRIAKLLMLAADNPNAHEAGAALAAAQRLMREHQISEEQVAAHAERSDMASCLNDGLFASLWRSRLAAFVQVYIGTVVVIRHRRGRRAAFEWFGRSNDIAWASSLFDALARTIIRECESRGWSPSREEGRSFAHGYIQGLWNRTRRTCPDANAIQVAAQRAKEYADSRHDKPIPIAKVGRATDLAASPWLTGVAAGETAALAKDVLAAPRQLCITEYAS